MGDVAVTPEGDIILATSTKSFGAEDGYTSNVWVLRLDGNGNVKWQKTYGWSGYDEAYTVAIAPNGDIIVAGYTVSFDTGKEDVWVLRLDENGNIKWQKTYGGSDNDGAHKVVVTPSGDIIIGGITYTFGAGAWILKLDEDGNIQWQKSYNTTNRIISAYDLYLLNDNESIVCTNDFLMSISNKDGNIKWANSIADGYATMLINGDIVTTEEPIISKVPRSLDLPDCDFCQDSKVIVRITNASVKTTNAEVRDSNAIIKDSNAEIHDIPIQVKTLYYYISPSFIQQASSQINNYKTQGIIVTPAEELLNKAQKAFQEENYEEAYNYTVQALKKAEEIKESYDQTKPTFDEAVNLHETLLKNNVILPSDVENLFEEAQNAFNKGDYELAHNLSTQFIEKANLVKEEFEKTKSKLNETQSKINEYKSQGVILTPAEELLNQAKQAFQQGDYISASSYASQALEKGEEIKDQYERAKEAISQAEGFLSPLGDAKTAFEKGDYVTAYQLAVGAKEKRDTYQKLFALGVVIIIGIVSVSAYRVHERKERERRVKKARELIRKAENAPTLEKLKLLEEARKLAAKGDKELAIKAERLLKLTKAETLLKEAENASLIEAVKLAGEALKLAGTNPAIKERAERMIAKAEDELNSILTRGDELLAGKKYGEAIKTYESAKPLAEALGKTDVLDSKIQTAKNLLERGRRAERFEALMSELNSALAKRDYETVGNILAEAQTLARELGRESTVDSVLDYLKTRFENVMERARDAELSGDYTSALALYTEALSLARLLDYDTTEIEEAVKSIESRRREELLKKSVKVDVPTEMPHKAETEVSIIVTNRFSNDMEVTVDLSDNAKYFELSESKIEFPPIEPGATLGEDVTVKPKFIGDFKFTVKVNSNFGSFERIIPVKVTKTARMSATPVTPSALTSTPILNPVEALQELYSDFQYIGEGGFARVYKAKRKDGKTVALKIPKTLDPAVGRAFVREITNWLHLKHPNIVELYDVNVLPVPYLEMEYCESSLARLQKPLAVDEASLIVFNIAEALKYAHSKKIVHRDLKPSNVLLKNGLPKISDWGLSKVLEESMSATTTASFTPFYAAPEQIDKKYGHTDERTDIWQLGVIFYELVTGRLPFEGSLSQVMMGILRDEPVPPSQLNPDAKKVERIIMKMLAKRKEERYQSVEELQRDLAKVLNMTYSESLRESKTLGDVKRATYYLTELLLINLKTNNAGEAYKYASDLAFYVKGELKEDVQKLAEQVKFRLEEGLDIPPELIEKAEIIVHKIRLGYGRI